MYVPGRLIPRRDLKHMALTGWTLETPAAFKSIPASDDDVIICCKQFWSDQVLSQKPMLLLPASRLQKLRGPAPTVACRPNKLSARCLREYRNTADKISEAPWNMTEGANYLRGWCAANEAGEIPNPAPPGWVVSDVNSIPLWIDKPISEEWRKYAPKAATPIQVFDAPGQQAAGRGVHPVARGRGRGRGRGGAGRGRGRGGEQRELSDHDGGGPEDLDEELAEGDGDSLGPAEPQHAPADGPGVHAAPPPAPVRPRGCPRCKYCAAGCATCKRPGYTPRGLMLKRPAASG